MDDSEYLVTEGKKLRGVKSDFVSRIGKVTTGYPGRGVGGGELNENPLYNPHPHSLYFFRFKHNDQ